MSRSKSITSIVFVTMLLIGILSMGVMLTPTCAATPIKIMPCGDSVTAGIGSTGNGSYRTDLYQHYTTAGISIDFVGSQSSGPSNLPDKNHEGHSGWTIPQIASNVNGWLNTYNPDVMLLMIGGNDTLQGTVPTSGLSSLIDQITNLKPNLILFVADYYYSLPSTPNYNQIIQYDAAIPGIVQAKADAGKKVYFVKLSDANLSTSEYADGLHPTDSGYSKLATIWYNSTISILKGTGTPTPTPVQTATPGTGTPTPTPVRTATPLATPTPVPPSGSIKIQFYNQSTAANSNQLYMNFKLTNTGSSALALSNVKLRYYYTKDGTQAQNFYCDYSPVGSSNIQGSFVTMSTAKTGADSYVEVGFLSGAGDLAAGGNITVQTRVAKSDWSNYTQSNDYSFNSSATTYVDWTKVTGYVSGELQWGMEP